MCCNSVDGGHTLQHSDEVWEKSWGASGKYGRLSIWQSVSLLIRGKNDYKINFIWNEKYYNISRRVCHNICQFW